MAASLAKVSWLLLLVALPSACDERNDDAELACSMAIAANWVKAPSQFEPRGPRSHRLSPEDRRVASDSRRWRTLDPGDAFIRDSAAFCGAATRPARKLSVSRDERWALAEFTSQWSVEQCLATRSGDSWRERECDVVMHIEPELPTLSQR